MTSMEDQAGTTHVYSYDGAGRLLSDAVTAFGAGVDTAVDSIQYTYKVCGKLQKVTSYGPDTEDPPQQVVKNQVLYQYDSNGNLVKEYEENDGTVDTTDGNTLYVAYGYDTAANGYRPTTLQYPTSTSASPGRTLTYEYGDSTDPDGVTGRVGAIGDSAEGGQTLDTYSYLGDDSITAEDYNQPNVGYNLLGTTAGHPNLDQFGRVVDQVWNDYGTGKMLDGYEYTYSLRGDVATKQNLALDAYNAANSPMNPVYLDEVYGYDDLDQLVSLARGQLSGGALASGTQDFSQGWTLDGNGNWTAFSQTNGIPGRVERWRGGLGFDIFRVGVSPSVSQ
jgi:hypothetical protein